MCCLFLVQFHIYAIEIEIEILQSFYVQIHFMRPHLLQSLSLAYYEVKRWRFTDLDQLKFAYLVLFQARSKVPNALKMMLNKKCSKCKAMRQTVFSKFFVFASFGNCRFSKIRVGTSFSSFFRTRSDSFRLVPTRNSTRKFG